MRKVRIFEQNHGLTSSENFRFFGHIKYIVLLSRKDSFLSRTPPNIFFWAYFQEKQTMKKVRVFDQNHGLHIRYIFLSSRKASFLSRTYLNIISGPIFNKKKNHDESLIFRPKSWVNPFGKFPIFWTYKIHVFIV